jgi:hypothetical protein
MCKSCIFRTDGNQVVLRPGRLDDIKAYTLKNSMHICHTTNKTCYGALTWQAEMFHRMGMIEDPTVECLLSTAAKTIRK